MTQMYIFFSRADTLATNVKYCGMQVRVCLPLVTYRQADLAALNKIAYFLLYSSHVGYTKVDHSPWCKCQKCDIVGICQSIRNCSFSVKQYERY